MNLVITSSISLGLIILSLITHKTEFNNNDVIEADKKLNRYIIEHNINEASALYAKEFILTTSSGKAKNKETMLSEIGLQDLVFEINETSDVTVRLLGNTAVLTGTLRQKGSYKQNQFDNKLLVTDTWVFIDNQWTLLAGHATLISKS